MVGGKSAREVMQAELTDLELVLARLCDGRRVEEIDG